MIWLLALILNQMPASATVLFIDLNDAYQEINACQAGLDEKHRKDPNSKREKVHTVKGSLKPGGTYLMIKAQLLNMKSQGIEVDSIAISGEDGNGEYFGVFGDLDHKELEKIYEEFPDLKKTVTTSALLGCYPSTVYGQEQYWLKNLPGMKATMGFVEQGPSAGRPENHNLLMQFCERRKQLAAMSSADGLCRFADTIEQLDDVGSFGLTSVGICNRQALFSRSYRKPGSDQQCFTYDDLKARCADFDAPAQVGIYSKYMTGEAEPDNSEAAIELRQAYNEMQKWRHCADQFEDRGGDLPDPARVIRLIKYQALKQNMQNRHEEQLRQYDGLLGNLGLSKYSLGDITGISRAEMNTKIRGAVRDLKERSDGQSQTLLRMAQCLNQTFVNLNPACTPFRAIAYDDKDSACILSPIQASQPRSPDEPC